MYGIKGTTQQDSVAVERHFYFPFVWKYILVVKSQRIYLPFLSIKSLGP